ncbi:MAG: lysostaphin resistance A-like protein [Candidatus Kapaibacterium sp.]
MSTRTFATSIVLVAIAWFHLFSGATELSRSLVTHSFWPGISVVSVLMLLFVGTQRRNTLGTGWWRAPAVPSDTERGRLVLGGLVHGVLWATISVGGLIVMRTFVPWLHDEAERIFSLSAQVPGWMSSVLLVLLIAPAEELFWRGYVLAFLSQRVGAKHAPWFMAALDALVHTATGNILLVGAAGFFGLRWARLRERTGYLLPCVISHAAWDIIVFVIYPRVA